MQGGWSGRQGLPQPPCHPTVGPPRPCLHTQSQPYPSHAPLHPSCLPRLPRLQVRAEPLKFREEGVFQVVKDVFLPWYNAYRWVWRECCGVEGVL